MTEAAEHNCLCIHNLFFFLKGIKDVESFTLPKYLCDVVLGEMLQGQKISLIIQLPKIKFTPLI